MAVNILTVMKNSEEKKDLRVRLRGDLKPKFDNEIGRFRVSQVDAVNHMVEWFLRQPDNFKAIILGSIPETLWRHAAREALREMDAKEKQKKAVG